MGDVVIDACSEIVLGGNAPYATRLAAEELNFFLKGVLGTELPVVPRRSAGRTSIVLGGDDPRLAALGRDGFAIEAKGDVLCIVGHDDDVADVAKTAFLPDEAPYQPCFRRGTLFGVYEFLERFAGVRMYFPGELGTCIPRVGRIIVPEGRIEGCPAFSVRRYGYADGPIAKDVLGGMDTTAFKRLNWYRLRMETEHLACCHGAKTHCLSPATWDSIYTNACAILASKQISNFKFQISNSPNPNNSNNLTNSGNQANFSSLNSNKPNNPNNTNNPNNSLSLNSNYSSSKSKQSKQFKQSNNTNNPNNTNNQTIPNSQFSILNSQFPSPLIFDAMPKDGFTWVRHCRCKWCKQNIPFSDKDSGFATDIVWRRTAELAAKIKTKFPNARVSQMSYIPYARIPTNDLPDNIEVFVARRGPWAEGTPIGDYEKDEVRRWHEKLGRKVSLWNYPDKVACWNLEMKDIPQIAPRAWAGYYHAVAPHVLGAFAESETDRWIYNYLNYYVFSRMCWNPDADVEAILAEHHWLMFGAAAKEMAEFFDTLERCWMKVVANPFDTPLGPGVCKAPTEEELRTKIYSPAVLARLESLLSRAAAKVGGGTLEARRIALFRREYFAPLAAAMGGTAASEESRDVLRIGLIADVHISDYNGSDCLRQALRMFDEKKADAVLAAGDLTDYGLLSELRQVAAAWNEVFPGNRRSDGKPIVRLFHYGDHDTELNAKARRREVDAKGRLYDYIPRIGVDVAWEHAFGEPFEPVVRRTIKGHDFTLVHFLPKDLEERFPQNIALTPSNPDTFHFFSQHRAYRGLFARPGRGDEVSWDGGASLAFLTNRPNVVAFCGHAHISAANETSFHRSSDGRFTAIHIPSLFYQIETWRPKPKGDHKSRQALFMTVRAKEAVVERLDVYTRGKLGQDWRID